MGLQVLRILVSVYLVFLSLFIVPSSAASTQSANENLAAPHDAERQSPVAASIELPAVVKDGPATVTDASGAFRFEGLVRGTHQLYLDTSTLPADLRPAADAPRVALWLNPGQSLISGPIGVGVRFSGEYDRSGTIISGVVFLDHDGDGEQDPTENGLAGVTVIDPALHQYFVPFDDDDLQSLYAEIYNSDAVGQCLNAGIASTTMPSFLSVTASDNGTIIYYDHWEDGYDPDPLNPGGTTEVSIIDAGVTKTFNDVVATPRISSTLQYDGRDRISVFGEPASVIRAVYPSNPGEVLAGAWEVPEVCDWGQSFVTVIGEDLDINPGAPDDFEYVGLQVMAAQPNTEIWLNGVLTATLGIGDTFFIDGENNGAGNGGVDSGDVITATGPVQVQMLGGACDTPHSARAFTLQPLDGWDNEYWAPVPDFDGSVAWCNIDAGIYPNNDRDTDIYIHNPHTTAITVTANNGFGSTPITVPPATTISVLNNDPGGEWNPTMGAHLTSSDIFWGVSVIDSISGDASPDSSFSNHSDWGYSLIPINKLSSEVIMGWSPGNIAIPPTTDVNGSLAFVSAFTDTVIYVDLNQDGTPDAFDMNGDGDADDFDVAGNPRFDERVSDDGVTLNMGEVLRVADPNDNDLTGAAIFTRDLGDKIAVAWGQDPCRARQSDPFLDMGYTVLPYPIPSLSKQSALALDADMSGDVSPGDTISYTIILHNNGLGPLLNAILTDTIPNTYTDFVVGSLTTSQPPLAEDYFDGSAWGYVPTATPDGDDPAVQAFRLTWPGIDARDRVTTTFRLLLDDDIPPEVEEISNQAIASSDGTPRTPSQDPEDPQDPDTDVSIGQPILQITKVDEPDPVRPGDLLTYTVVSTNTGTGTALGALVLETLPPYVTYQPGTLNLTLPRVISEVLTMTVPFTTTFTGSYADDFDLTLTQTTNYTGSDGSLAWATDWAELGDDGSPVAGDVRVGSTGGDGLSPLGYLELTDGDGLDSSILRTVDLSDFVAPALSFYVLGISDGADDTYEVLVNGIPVLPAEQYDGPYQQRTLDLTAFATQPAVIVQFTANAGMENTDFYRIDNITLYETSPLRSGTQTLVDTISVLTYTTQTGIDPVSYDPVGNVMTVTNEIRIPPSARVSFDFQVLVASPLPNGMQLLNTAAITSTNVVTQPFPLEDDETTTVLSSHALTITKDSVTDTVYIGQQFDYTLFWEVGGDEPAPGLVVTDTLPWPYVSFVGCEGGLGCDFISPDTVVWELGDRLPIASGILYDSGLLTLTVRAEQYPPTGVFTNTVIIDDATPVPPDEDDEPTNVIDVGFVLSKQRFNTPSPVTVGENVEFLIVITNTGAVTITHLPLVDTYDPLYLEYQDALPPPDSTSPGTITWDDLTDPPGADLSPGESTQVWVQFVALTSTQQLSPPVTINTAVSDGAETDFVTLPPVQDEEDIEIEPDTPTAIELLYFRANPKAGGVLVEWATLYEIGTYGFWLYRSADNDLDHAAPVAFIPSKGWYGLGAFYQYLDAALPLGRYYYWLIEVENDGKETAYGPVSTLSGWGEADLPYRIYLPLIRRN